MKDQNTNMSNSFLLDDDSSIHFTIDDISGRDLYTPMHPLYTPMHPLYTLYTPPVQPLYTPYTLPVHPLFTPCSPPVHPYVVSP